MNKTENKKEKMKNAIENHLDEIMDYILCRDQPEATLHHVFVVFDSDCEIEDIKRFPWSAGYPDDLGEYLELQCLNLYDYIKADEVEEEEDDNLFLAKSSLSLEEDIMSQVSLKLEEVQ
jgi:hypothetical protein